MDKVRLFIISGPASVGKTTVARILATHLSEKTAIVDGDDVQRFRCANCDGHKLFIKNSHTIINNFLQAGIDVIFSHSLLPEEVVDIAKEIYSEEVKVIFLTADLKTLQMRNKTRSVEGQTALDLQEDLKRFEDAGIEPKHLLDNSNLSLTQTAKTIIESDRFILK